MDNELEQIVTVRDFVETDLPFVKATFLTGLYYGDSWFGQIPKDVFMKNYTRVADALVSSHNVYVACLKDDEDIILGYAMMTKDGLGLDWVFVKKSWRERGIARMLVPEGIQWVTHLTGLGKILLEKLPEAKFNPFYGVMS